MRLSREGIVEEALTLLDESGLDRLSLRRLATRLDVAAPTLYWYLRDKRELIGELGEAIVRSGLDTLPDPDGMDWRDWLTEVAVAFRNAMLRHRDGGRIVSAAQLSPAMAELSERAMAVLVVRGEPLRRARLFVLLVERFTLGLVLEEQAGSPDPAAISSIDPDETARRYPTLTAGVRDYFADGATLDDLFRDSLQLLLDASSRSLPLAAPQGQPSDRWAAEDTSEEEVSCLPHR